MGNVAMIPLGPGLLKTALTGTALPTDLVSPWPTGWVEPGFTKEGSKFAHAYSLDPVEVAELLEPAGYEVTGRTGVISFDLAELTATHLTWLLNGGTITAGAGIVTVTPPSLSGLVERMWGFESRDGTERWVWKRCLNGGTSELERRKGANYATLGFEVQMMAPLDGSVPFVTILSSTRA